MNKRQLSILSLAFLFMYSCKKEDEAPELIDNTPPPVNFKAESYFSASIFGENVRIDDDDSNTFPTNAWFGNTQEDFSIIQFGNYFNFNNRVSDIMIVSFAKSYHDSSLLLNNNPSSYQRYFNKNPLKNSSDFHDIFKTNGSAPFYYSENHDGNQFPTKAYAGLVVQFKFNNKWYDSYSNYKTDSLNTYEVLKYEILRDSSSIKVDDIYYLPYGKVKIRFDCYLEERNGGAGRIHIKDAEFQGIINEN